MRIVCPACAAAYDVPDAQLAPGRVVRCARCETDWVPVALAPSAEPVPAAPEPPTPREMETGVPAPPEAETEDEDRRGPPVAAPVSAPERSGRALRAAWLISLVAVGGGIYALFSARERIMTAWPPSTRAYTAIGLADHR